MTTTLHLSQHYWDLAGIDGLPAVRSLFGNTVNQLAPFQSRQTHFGTSDCAILQLCEGNFRIAVQDDAAALEQALKQAATQYQVWVKQFDWLSAIVIPESVGLAQLPHIATVKPPYRLQGMGRDRAVPARIQGIAVLIWRHAIAGQPAFELHTATRDRETVKNYLGLSINSF